MAYYDKPNRTIRHVECALLLDDGLPPCCSQCKRYRVNSLNRLLYRHLNSVTVVTLTTDIWTAEVKLFA